MKANNLIVLIVVMCGLLYTGFLGGVESVFCGEGEGEVEGGAIAAVATAAVTAAVTVAPLQSGDSVFWDEIERDWHLKRSIGPRIDSIYTASMTSGNYRQALKALVYRLNLTGHTKDNDSAAFIITEQLRAAALQTPEPYRSIACSMLGQIYKEYNDRNRGTTAQRTYMGGDCDDIATCDSRGLMEAARRYYRLSLSSASQLQSAPIEEYGELLTDYDADEQPTLYDVLVSRALAFFSSQYSTRELPSSPLKLGEAKYYADANSFVELPIASLDSQSAVSETLQLYQQLLRFHLGRAAAAAADGGDSGGKALISADLRRIKYLRLAELFTNSELYEASLQRMLKEYSRYTYAKRIELELADYYCDRGYSWRHSKQLSSRDGYVKALSSLQRASATGGILGAKSEEIAERIKQRELEVSFEAMQTPGRPYMALIRYRNLSALYQTVYPLSESEYLEYINTVKRYVNGIYQDDAAFIGGISGKPQKRRIALPEQSDYQYYTTAVRLEALERGAYLVLLSDGEDALSSSLCISGLIQSSSLSSFARQTVEGMSLLIADRSSGSPVSGAKITFSDESSLPVMTSDKDGLVRLNSSPSRRSYKVEHGNDRLIVNNEFVPLYRFRRENEQYQSLLLTDRTLYRPGQTLYYKGILYVTKPDESRSLLKERRVSVRLLDANRQIVNETSLVSNEYGSVDGSFILPQGLLNGAMSIEIEGFSSTFIRVEEYRRPTFEVRFDTLRSNYRLNEAIRVRGEARAYSGYAAVGAMVSYRVRRAASSPYRWVTMTRTEREIATGETQTDNAGAFEIDFTAIADESGSAERIYDFIVSADVTDISGETQTAVTHVRLSAVPLIVKSNLPARIASDNEGEYSIETTNLNGALTPSSVRVQIARLSPPATLLRRPLLYEAKQLDFQSIPEAEYRRDFPYDAYGDELEPSQYAVIKDVAEYRIEIADRKAALDLSSLKKSGTGYYRMTASAEAAEAAGKGIIATDTVYFRYGETAITMDDWVSAVKTVGEPGEAVELRIAGGLPESYVYYELIHRLEVKEARWLKVGKNPYRLMIPVKEEYRGGFQVQLKLVRHNRQYTFNQAMRVPYSNKQLSVRLGTFRDKLLPGSTESWNMTVSGVDSAGQGDDGVRAEVAATLYDASLDAISAHAWPSLESVYNAITFFDFSNSWHGRTINAVINRQASDRLRFGGVNLDGQLTDINWRWAEYQSAFARPGSSFMIRGLSANSSSLLKSAAVVSAPELMDDISEPVVAGFAQQRAGSTVGEEAASVLAEAEMDGSASPENITAFGKLSGASSAATKLPPVIQPRRNFNETAFFYPRIATNERGEVLLQFTVPEALTRWKLFSFAHTEDFRIGTYTNELVTQKEVSVSANAPRFFREGDEIDFTAKLSNLTESALECESELRLFDAESMTEIGSNGSNGSNTLKSIVEGGGSSVVSWRVRVPAGLSAITCRVTTRGGSHSDGEEKTIPVLTNAQLVTESLPFSVRGGKSKALTFKGLKEQSTETQRNESVTLEFTSAPAWYAIRSLPYIMEYPYECSEQMFSRYYANSIAGMIVERTPRLRRLFELWKTENSGAALTSALEKNAELKQVMLEETPWVLSARNETDSKRRMGQLFDLNHTRDEQSRTEARLAKLQNSDGGFPWFEQSPSSRYITQHIVAGLGHLQRLGVQQYDVQGMVARALAYIDGQMWENYDRLLRSKSDMEQQHIDALELHYLYARSFYKEETVSTGAKESEAFDYYLAQAEKYWSKMTTCQQGLAALVLHRNGKEATAKRIITSLKERSIETEEMGMYWKDNVSGIMWHQSPIETQALLIEAFSEVSNDVASVEAMRVWLLRNKQTHSWATTKATTEAVYALLMSTVANGSIGSIGSNDDSWGSILGDSALLEVTIGGRSLSEASSSGDVKAEAGTGYVKTSWRGAEITPSLGDITVRNPNTGGIAWGAMYRQYFEQLDKITSASSGLKVSKALYLRVLTPSGEELRTIDTAASSGGGSGNDEAVIKVGDLVRVRIELRADRDYEYVHLKDMRASSFEPANNALSGYRSEDGLWYYMSMKDASANWFITYLPKGVYVLEYDLRVTQSGTFSNGITTVQSMYAPEFVARSKGEKVKVYSL